MICPICNVDLLIADRQGIEIDYCPKCRGIWLDRGELDKLIERSAMETSTRGEYRESPAHRGHPAQQGHYEEHHKSQAPRKHKRGSFLGDIFDFD
ncbi:MAG: zf-TFIIB domain-containing protein [Syntrophobacteraceae bacterium]